MCRRLGRPVFGRGGDAEKSDPADAPVRLDGDPDVGVAVRLADHAPVEVLLVGTQLLGGQNLLPVQIVQVLVPDLGGLST